MSAPNAYRRQHRGDRGAYERYLAGMDASIRQKVALTAAHLLGQGRVADMGMGSGASSHALAALYPALTVVGVDVNPTMVALAREHHRLANLSFACGDIAAPCLAAGSLDGIFDSSVLHHVTTFGGYDHEAAARCLEVQAGELREHGVLIVRDFVDPGPGLVLLDLPTTDGDSSDDPQRCCSAALFERFSREFRKLLPQPGFVHEKLPDPRAGVRRFRVTRTLAAEFALRKDYRADWDSEVLEEYSYFTQARFEAEFARLGLRILASTPLRNPWIVRHRFVGRLEIRDVSGAPEEFPPTNYVIVGEKVPPDEGVRLIEAADAAPLGFLQMERYRDRRDGRVRDLVRRPHLTLDVLPWFEVDGDVFVLARGSYPRPILACQPRGTRSLDGSRAPEYVTEPLSVLQQDKPIGQTVEEALARLAGIEQGRILWMHPGGHYYPSPGGVQEEVRALLVETTPAFVEQRLESTSGFSTSGLVRAIEARQLLRAAQVGGLPDARLEHSVYALLARLGRDPGPWIGAAIDVPEAPPPAGTTRIEALLARPRRRVFEGAPEADGRFLELRAARFDELDRDGTVLAQRALEFVLPRTLSFNTLAVAALWRHQGAVLIGLDDDDLPAAQAFSGGSELLVAPAFRLPRDVVVLTQVWQWLRERLRCEHGLECGEICELGGRYHPSPGCTPEVVYPLAVSVLRETGTGRPLRWVPLADAAAQAAALQDGHLLTVAQRAAHALGLLAPAV